MGAGGAEWHADLCANLRQVRLHGIPKSRGLTLPSLQSAVELLGHRAADLPMDLAVEALLREAIARFGDSPEANAANRTFGLSPGLKMSKPADRRRAAARAQGVSIETFRKSYEPALIEQVASEIAGLLSRREPAERAPSVPAQEQGPPTPPTFAQERHVADVLRAAHANADWGLVEGLYRQCIAITDGGNGHFLPSEPLSSLARAFGRISANYHRREEDLVLHGLSILGNAENADMISAGLFSRLYADPRFDRFVPYRPVSGGDAGIRRRPRPFESLVETARRYRDLNHLHAVLADLPTTCILGGSMNYGRYYSVRGSAERDAASNVDIMIVIPDFGWLDELLSGVSTLAGCARSSLTTLEQRARLWRENRLDDGRTVFTQRLSMWSDGPDPLMAWAPNRGEYTIDLRVASVDALDWLLVADTPKLTAAAAGNSRPVRDFCQPGRDTDEHLRSFSGRHLRAPLDADRVDDSLLLTYRGYSIHEDRYHPGSLQNLILPRFNKRWDNAPIGGKLETFRWKIIERLREERRAQPYEVLRVSLSHTRGDGFAPHMLRSIDQVDPL
jgi:hypothetical protein